MAIWIVLAQEGGGGGQEASPGGFMQMLFPILAMLALFYFIMLRPQKREQQTRMAMLKALKKNDRVMTTGGIYGVVTNVQLDADEVTLRVDEASNTKLRVALAAISKVLTDDDKSKDKPADKDTK